MSTKVLVKLKILMREMLSIKNLKMLKSWHVLWCGSDVEDTNGFGDDYDVNWLIMMFWRKRCCQKTILKNWPVLWCGRRQRQGRSRRAGSPSPFICSQNFARVGLASKPWFLSKGLASQSVIKILMWIFAVKFWMRCWWCTFSNWWCN